MVVVVPSWMPVSPVLTFYFSTRQFLPFYFQILSSSAQSCFLMEVTNCFPTSYFYM